MIAAPLLALFALSTLQATATQAKEEDYYRIVNLPVPEGLSLEVSGLATLSDGRPIVATRRGEIYLVEKAYAEDPAEVEFELIAEGLQEPLGLLVHGGWIYCVQRGELSRMRDVDGDLRMDELETVCDDWRISGNYHEYNFGPRLDAQGNLWITTNKPFGGEPFGRVLWRGFALRISPEGVMRPVACGLRSPAGIEASPEGEMFFTDNQGEWCGAGKLSHIEPGDFHGHPWGLFSCDDPRWTFGHPGMPPDGVPMPRVAETVPSFKLPAVWFPYDEMGRSPAGFVWDRSEGRFGPFAGQVFVGDQYDASVMRVFLERVGGRWQGACFPFRYGFQCGIVRLAWGGDGSLLAGMTNRGWGGRGRSTFGLERLVWTGETPFEIHEMRALPDGFRLSFTQPVSPQSASDVDSYSMQSYTYLLHQEYGSDEIETQELEITSAEVGADGRSVRLRISGLRPGYVHELRAEGLRSSTSSPLLHARAYYTLIEIPSVKSEVR